MNLLHLVYIPIIFVLLGVIAAYHLHSRKRYQAFLSMKQTLRDKTIEAQEEERKRISHELHDSIGQALYSVLVGLKIIKNLKIDSSFRDHLLEMERMTDKALDEVKRLAAELRPATLDDLGLVPAIRSYLDKYERTFGIHTTFQLIGKHGRYSEKLETALYRIAQEALTNAAKYAEASQVNVQITNLPGQLLLHITDDGRGFSSGMNKPTSGLGLYNMKERVESIGGNLAIHSEIDKGTRIEVQVIFH
ncbi:Oxygen sensor histidine kinase NreB [Paenibacillus plantiphilus]|uniref:histidine kinase n=1 Tax=Paenibacillus plantiphilus TaxID=2905650 RepID=A0ABM9CJS9_9BACL|nr:sensor histidine kinase [Paenibacillus plantiphilus]CAH1214907.1 Oxygen sensor histidine kinase NreB [Paenibacillus plantiphilus]